MPIKCPIRKKEVKRRWYLKNRQRTLSVNRKYVDAHKAIVDGYKAGWYKEQISRWIGVVPEVTNCQCCAKEIFIHTDNSSKSICFDHRQGGNEPIKGSPKIWLRSHAPTLENIAIWKSCAFGMLCWDCNRMVPTKDRIEQIKRINKYVGLA